MTALADVSFEIGKGEVVGFLGVNGAGKTTLMRILTGFLPATRGQATVAGFDVLRKSLEVRRRIGYLPEGVPLYREHRIEEMLRFQARLHGLKGADADRRIDEVLERVQLTERRRTPIGQLSKGLRQRAGIAVALLPAPEVLILDEPTSGLDPLQRIEVRELIKGLADEHTVLLSSHILPEVEAMTERLIILHKGRVAADGTRAELVGALGSPSHVRLEAVVGIDAATPLRLLGQVEGVASVRDGGRLGIHHTFDIFCDQDLREDVGALAAAKGWALRELSWHAPSVEDLFARIALELDPGDALPGGDAAAPAAGEAPTLELDASLSAGLLIAGPEAPTAGTPTPGALPLAPEAPASPGVPGAPAPAAPVLNPFEQPPPKKAYYSLNPFDGNMGRDLSSPVRKKPAPVETPRELPADPESTDAGPSDDA